MEPRIVPPGGNAIVEVEADPLEYGDKSVPIVIRADSLGQRSSLDLTLNIHGRQRPPYLARAAGDLYFRSEYIIGERRNIMADVIEGVNEDHRPPKVTVMTSYFKVGVPSSKPVEHIYAPDSKMKVYSWEIPLVLVSKPPVAGFHCSAIVQDPWVEGRSIEIPIHGEADPPVRVIPARLVLFLPLNKSSCDAQSTTFIVQNKWSNLPLRVENVHSEDQPLLIESLEMNGPDKRSAFRLSIKPGKAVSEGVYELAIYVDGHESERVIVPVLVKKPR
jgi:hypothetical protein